MKRPLVLRVSLLALLLATACSSTSSLPAPTGLSSTLSTAPLSVKLSWNPVNGATGYVVERKSGLAASYQPFSTPTNSYTDTSVAYGNTYMYRLKAVSGGASSAYSSELSVSIPVQTAPPTPTAFQSTAMTSSTVTLSWAASVGASSYILERKSGAASFAIVSSAATSPFTDTGLSPNTLYTYRLKAKNDSGESAYTELSVTTNPAPGSPPAAPTNLSGSANATPAITLTWEASSGAESYTVERKTSGNYTVIGTSVSNTYTDSAPSVAPATSYTYRVRANNGAGSSGYSNELSISTPAPLQPPGNPTGLVLTPATTSISLSWQPPTSGGQTVDYTLERKPAVGDYGTPVTVNGTSYTDTGLSPNTLYTYRLKARNSAGSSPGLEQSTQTLASLTCAVGSSDNLDLKGCFGEVMNWPAVATHMALLPDGKVIFWYSMDPIGLYRESTTSRHDFAVLYLWDPVSHSITSIQNNTTDLFCAGFTVTVDGSLFFAGGNLGAQWGLNHTNIYNPKTNTWTRGPDMARGRWYPTVTKLASGELLITGGSFRDTAGQYSPIDNNQSAYNRDFERYTAGGSGRTLLGPNFDGLAGSDDFEGFYPWWFVAPNGMAFIAGMAGKVRFLDTGGSGQWVGSSAYTRDPSFRLYGTAVMYQPGKILTIGGGYSLAGQTDGSTDTTTYIDITNAPGSPSFTPGPTLDQERTHLNATLLADGQIFVNGGNDGRSYGGVASGGRWDATGAAKKGLLLDPSSPSNPWRAAALAKRVRIYHSSALLLPDGSVLTAGGGGCGDCADGEESHKGWDNEPLGPATVFDPVSNSTYTQTLNGRRINQMNAEIYYPPYLFKNGQPAPRPFISSVSGSGSDAYGNPTAGYGATLTLATPDAASIAKVSLVAFGAATHAFNQNQRYLALEFSSSGQTLTISTPASPNLAPPGYYLLFILNDQGVPSVARIVRIS